jgi:hypothetical protein
MSIEKWGLEIGDWGLGIGDWEDEDIRPVIRADVFIFIDSFCCGQREIENLTQRAESFFASLR